MTQKQRVLHYLRLAGSDGLTGLELATRTGSMRYSARILELRAEGHTITTEAIGKHPTTGAAIYRYRLVEQAQGSLFGEAA